MNVGVLSRMVTRYVLDDFADRRDLVWIRVMHHLQAGQERQQQGAGQTERVERGEESQKPIVLERR